MPNPTLFEIDFDPPERTAFLEVGQMAVAEREWRWRENALPGASRLHGLPEIQK